MATWVLILIVFNKAVGSVPMHTERACVNVMAFYNTVNGIDARCANTVTGEVKTNDQ